MAKHEVEVSPRALARVAGVRYLITIVVCILNEALAKGRIVRAVGQMPYPLQSHTVNRSCASLRGTHKSNKENIK